MLNNFVVSVYVRAERAEFCPIISYELPPRRSPGPSEFIQEKSCSAGNSRVEHRWGFNPASPCGFEMLGPAVYSSALLRTSRLPLCMQRTYLVNRSNQNPYLEHDISSVTRISHVILRKLPGRTIRERNAQICNDWKYMRIYSIEKVYVHRHTIMYNAEF